MNQQATNVMNPGREMAVLLSKGLKVELRLLVTSAMSHVTNQVDAQNSNDEETA